MQVARANTKLDAYLRRRTWGIAVGGALLVIIWLARAFVEHLSP